MPQITLEQFFAGKYFRIPSYQRDYAWEVKPQIDDFFNDFLETVEIRKFSPTSSAANHYLGTCILHQTTSQNVYTVVDGQQRLTTLTMVLNEIIERLPDPNDQIINRDKFLVSATRRKLELSVTNHSFFVDLLHGNTVSIGNRSQRLLKSAYDEIFYRIQTIMQDNIISLLELLDALKYCEVLEFIEVNESRAIRIFQTVNDRGKPLSNMEKSKSLLIYYSNKYLSGTYDSWINDEFGKIFRDYDDIKELAEANSISPISNRDFNEDSIMRYHFLAYKNDNISDRYDFYASIGYVLEIFLKQTLNEVKQSGLDAFIQDYVADLQGFFQSLKELLAKVDREEKYYKLFSILKLSAILFPLATRLQSLDLLDQPTPNSPNKTFLDLIDIAEVRIYKVKGSDPVKDVSLLARNAKNRTTTEIETALNGFVVWFLDDADFRSRIQTNIFDRKTLLRRVFIEYDEDLLQHPYSMIELKQRNNIPLRNTPPTIEHIFPQMPTFPVQTRHFRTDEEYYEKISTIGNLLLLEGELNSALQNKSPEHKVMDRLYMNSLFESTKIIAASIKNKGKLFSRLDVEQRTSDLSTYCLKRWAI